MLTFQHAQRQQVEKKRLHDEFNIATGLFRSNKSVFAIGAVGGRSTPDAANEANDTDIKEKMDDDRALTAKPQGQGSLNSSNEKNAFSDKLMQKRILRKVCTLTHKEMIFF